MTDTLKSIRSFWSAYDVRFFAHDIPCDAIDYQLALPVAPEKQGVNFLLCYLNRLAFETDFLRRYPVQELRPVLRAYCPDYYGLLINLYEPIATNALGRCLLHLSPHSLDLTAQDLKALLCLLASLDREQLAALLREAASDVSSQLELRPRQARQYLKRYAETLIPRIVAACQKGDLSFLFLSALH